MENIDIILNNIQILSSETYHNLIEEYDKKEIDLYLDNKIKKELLNCISKEEKIKVWDKYSYYLSTKEHSIYEQLELNSLTTTSNNYLFLKEQLIYGLHLLSKKNLIILKNPSNENTLDIKRILASIKTIKTRDYIINKLINFYNNKTNVSVFDHDIKETIKKYCQLCQKDIIPVFKEVTNTIDEEYLIEQIDMYVRYCTAKEKFINKNLNLVKYVAAKKLKITNNYEDLTSEGLIALNRAIDNFDVRKGYAFSNYATIIISKEIIDKQRIYKYGIIIPSPNHFNYFKIKNKKKELTNILKRKPTLEELANNLGITENQLVKELLIIKRANCFSLDTINTTIEDKEPVTLENIIIDENSEIEEKVINEIIFKEILSKIDTLLTEKEKTVLLKRIGYNIHNKVLNLDKIGKEIGMSHEGVRRIEQRAIKKLKKYYHQKN